MHLKHFFFRFAFKIWYKFKKGGEFELKPLLITLFIALSGIFLLVCSVLSGFLPLGIGLLAIILVSAFIYTISDKWADFLMFYVKSLIYALIAIISIFKVISHIISNDSSIMENFEFVLIAVVSVVESIHNLILWKNTVDNLPN
jgi:hypothetical protein